MHAEPIPSLAGGDAARRVQEDTSFIDPPSGGGDHVVKTVEAPLTQETFMAQTAAAALNIVHEVLTINAFEERDAANARLAEIKKLYPHLFLTDEDIDQSSGAFMFYLDEQHWMDGKYQRVVYKGRTQEGLYKWGPADAFTQMPLVAKDLAWQYCTRTRHRSEGELDEDGNVALSESQMARFTLAHDDCKDDNDYRDREYHRKYCLICGSGGSLYDSGSGSMYDSGSGGSSYDSGRY